MEMTSEEHGDERDVLPGFFRQGLMSFLMLGFLLRLQFLSPDMFYSGVCLILVTIVLNLFESIRRKIIPVFFFFNSSALFFY